MLVTTYRFYADTENNGFTEKILERLDEYTASGMSENDAAKKAFRFVQNKLLELPDLPPMYDYEFTPQSGSRINTPMLCKSQYMVWQSSRDIDALICESVPEIDGDSIEMIGKILGVPTMGIGSAKFPC